MASDRGSEHYEALLGYIKQGNVDMAFDQAFAWVKDGTLIFSEWKKFLKVATAELIAQEKRQAIYRG